MRQLLLLRLLNAIVLRGGNRLELIDLKGVVIEFEVKQGVCSIYVNVKGRKRINWGSVGALLLTLGLLRVLQKQHDLIVIVLNAVKVLVDVHKLFALLNE